MKEKEVDLTNAEYKKLLRTAQKRYNGRGEDVAQEALASAIVSFNPKKGSLYRYASRSLRSANAELLKHEGFSENVEGGKKYYVREEFSESYLTQCDDISSLLDLAESVPYYERIIPKNRRRNLHE